MTAPAVGDVVLVRCVVTDTARLCYSKELVLDVHLDGREHVRFSCIHGVHTHPLSESDKEPTSKMNTTTYTIHRNNRRFNAKKFSRYEEARSYVRRWLRKNELDPGKCVPFNFDYSWIEYRNPEISRYGFSIKRVEG